MKNGQHSTCSFDTRNLWAMPMEKPTRGKPVKEILLLLSS